MTYILDFRDVDKSSLPLVGGKNASLGEMIKAVRGIRREKIAVLTNSSLMDREDIRQDLSLADLVVCKLDAPSQYVFKTINGPMKNIKIDVKI